MMRWSVLMALFIVASLSLTGVGQDKAKAPQADAPDAERQVVDRFLTVLEKNPRRGTLVAWHRSTPRPTLSSANGCHSPMWPTGSASRQGE